ncbi:formaldehyde-responsive transcriptional repressor FrmR [Paraburkholderia sp. RL17-383-BIF-A]|jgi:DNA-binding FrmR family transcriptional regulator|uniref:formaldehyde-responsive transcriptional repressor FrmR n=1 Tax=Burkholderiaceae TaxID=119060 RepID=UPI00089ACF1D|nr:formaldehyde-responsive transcriptional repressor FrmR [Burkholderia sp. WP9]SEF07992.1 DNA-binding transcriptional regulator, FrmR family [Burkholderia sp. WP9]
MPHTIEEQKRVLARVRRIKGQLDALENALVSGTECGPILQQIAAVRGAVNGLMAGVLESHLREEFPPVGKVTDSQQASIENVVSLVKSYLK